MANRDQLINEFLHAAGWAGAERSPLAGDASFRRYERIKGKGQHAVLMDAPPPQEDVRPFIRVGEQLLAHGMSAPRVIARDVERGFLLLEDLGDTLYSRLLRELPQHEEETYLAAADVLIALYEHAHKADYTAFAPYDTALLMRECMLLPQWFLPAIYPAEKAKQLEAEYEALWRELLTTLPAQRPVLVQRDYHADNLLWLPQRKGIARVGLLDFQDAVIGSPAYDMVSYLEDARRDVSASTVERAIAHYLSNTKQDAETFGKAYAMLGAQRNCKIIGIFVRLAVRDGKPNYLSFLPRVWKHLERDVSHPSLKRLAAWLDQHIPSDQRGVLTLGKAA